MYFCGVPWHRHVETTLLAPVVGVSVRVPPAAAPSLLLLDSVTVMTPLAPTSVLATNCVVAVVPEQPAWLTFVGSAALATRYSVTDALHAPAAAAASDTRARIR